MSAWVIVGAGIVIYMISTKIPAPRKAHGVRISRIASFLGIAVLATGLYAGMKGPIVFGKTTIAPFSFAHSIQKAEAEATAYALGHISLSSHPGGAWRGASKDSLKCTVVNRGDKSLTYLIFRFVTKGNTTVDLPIRGPYPPNSTKSVHVTLPDNVSRSYFLAPGMTANQICGAAF